MCIYENICNVFEKGNFTNGYFNWSRNYVVMFVNVITIATTLSQYIAMA